MVRWRSHVPAYRLHKPSGQARVIVRGEHKYLGKFGSDESRENYARLIAELNASCGPGGFPPAGRETDRPPLSVDHLILAYWRFAKSHYVKDGSPTREIEGIRFALRPVRQLYGSAPAANFGPKSLKAVRQHMVDADLSRGVTNRRVGIIKRAFKWAVAEELVPPHVYHGLQAVTGLTFGRTKARETEPVRPVPDLYVAIGSGSAPGQVTASAHANLLTGAAKNGKRQALATA